MINNFNENDSIKSYLEANFVHLEINTAKEIRFNMDMNSSSSWEQIYFGYNWNETNLLKFRHEKVGEKDINNFYIQK